MAGELRRPIGHVVRVERARGPVWYAKYRLPDGRQVQRKLGPAWTGRSRPAAGYFTKRLAEFPARPGRPVTAAEFEEPFGDLPTDQEP